MDDLNQKELIEFATTVLVNDDVAMHVIACAVVDAIEDDAGLARTLSHILDNYEDGRDRRQSELDF